MAVGSRTRQSSRLAGDGAKHDGRIDRIRACWIGDAIERYVAWLTEQNYAARNVFGRIPILCCWLRGGQGFVARRHDCSVNLFGVRR